MCFFGTKQLQDWARQKLLSIDWSSGLAKPRLERKLSQGLSEENRGFFPPFLWLLGLFYPSPRDGTQDFEANGQGFHH